MGQRIITDKQREFIAGSSLAFVMSGVRGESPDISPRGDFPGFVRILDNDRLQLPDRRGNNRVDTMHNVVRSPQVTVVFLMVGDDRFLSVEGDATIRTEANLLKTFEVSGALPRSIMEIVPRAVRIEQSAAFAVSSLWEPDPDQKGQNFEFGTAVALQVGGIDPDAQQEDVRVQYATKLY